MKILIVISIFLVLSFKSLAQAVTASDCSQAVNICNNLTFAVDPNGFGTIDEIPFPGSISNPAVNPSSLNAGCLLSGENNSTWMVVNISSSGNLEFNFGGGGSQAGFYDWAMWPFNATTCSGIANNLVAPVRCNWNAVDFGGTGLATPIPGGGDPGNYEAPLPVLAGQKYLICFSNYSSLSTTVPLVFETGPGNAGVTCTPLGDDDFSFNYTCNNNELEITLSNSTLISNSYFEVSRKCGDGDFEKVSDVLNLDMSNKFIDQYACLENTVYNVKLKTIPLLTIKEKNFIVECGANDVLVYPNPFNEDLEIKVNNKISEVKVIDLSGVERYFLNDIYENYITISIDNLDKGFYLIYVKNNKEEIVVKKVQKI